VRGLRYSAAALYLSIGESFCGEAGDVGFLICQFFLRLHRASVDRLAGGGELASRAIRERLGPHRGELLVGRS